MSALVSAVRHVIDAMLPFTNPSTPLLQDLIHSLILCGILYFAPQLVEYCNTRQPSAHIPLTGGLEHESLNEQEQEPPLDEGFVLQPDTDDDFEADTEPPPLAPTPPPAQARQPQADARELQDGRIPPPDLGEAGPANERPRPTPQNRTIGAKKARSLARKDQRRAYHEFHRQQAELRRAEEARDASEREVALLAEKARRAEVEREIQERERVERERKKEVERKELEEERLRRERTVKVVRQEVEEKGSVDLVEVAWLEGKDRVWIEKLVRASGLLTTLKRDGSVMLITGDAWIVTVDEDMMKQAYLNAVAYGEKHGGRIGFGEFGGILEKVVRARTRT